MDRDELRREAAKWVEARIVSPDQAGAIVAHYEDEGEDGEGGESGQSRFVVAVSLMGAALVGAGILLSVGSEWDALPRWLRTVVALVTPVGFGVASVALALVAAGLFLLAAGLALERGQRLVLERVRPRG